jgi:plastocyanin
MRKLTLSLVVVAAVFVPVVHAAPTKVLVKDNFFKPKEVTITKGSKVTWRWKGSQQHNVALKKPGRSNVARRSALKTSGKFTHKFRRVGTWKVLCEVHSKMKMKVVVRRS